MAVVRRGFLQWKELREYLVGETSPNHSGENVEEIKIAPMH
jgi:hypothetical protein